MTTEFDIEIEINAIRLEIELEAYREQIENLHKHIEKLHQELENANKKISEVQKYSGLTLKIIDYKGRKRLGITFGAYTCSLFKSQWIKILNQHDEVRAFIQENDDNLD